MRALALFLLLALVVLHHDFWWWDDSSLVLGFLPIGLAWHAGISLAAGLAWWLMTRSAWPRDLETDEGAEAEGTR